MSYHLYRINELYSDPSGRVQFIEMAVGNADGESFWAGQSIDTSRAGVTHTYTFARNLPSTATANTTVLIATQGLADATGITPDFIVPDGFLFAAGGTLDFAGVDTITYPALPADGAHSLTRAGVAQTATPRTFAGAGGSLPTLPPTVTGTAGDDTLAGSSQSERIEAGDGNDTLFSTAGNDTLDGGNGIDTAVYALARGAYTLHRATDGVRAVEKPDAAGSDTLAGIERLRFSDTRLALDLDGHAGLTARLIGAVFGPAALANKSYVGIGLTLLDSGTGEQDLAALAMSAAGRTTHADVVTLLWTNLVGSPPTAAQAAPFVAQLDAGLAVGALTLTAANLELNATNIGLVGLAQTGIEYSL